MVQGLEIISAHFMYESAKVSGELKTFLLQATSVAQREIANCIAMLSYRMAIVREASPVKSSASALGAIAAAAGTAPSTSKCPSVEEGPQ